MDKILAIFDTDVSYATRFTEYLQKRKEIGFEVAVFTKLSHLLDFTEDQPVEILLYCDNQQFEEISRDNIKYIFCLTDARTSDNIPPEQCINKYQSANNVLSEVISCYTRLESETGQTSTGAATYLSVYSTHPKGSTLSFAWFLATSMAEIKRTLFIPLELFPIDIPYTAEATNPSLSEFIYYLKENDPNIITKMKSLLKYSGKLSYLSGITHGLDLMSITKEEITKWMDKLRDQTDYEAVIFYLGIYTEASIEIMNQCEVILFTEEDNPNENSYYMEWERQMKLINIHMKPPKLKRVTIPKDETIEKEAATGVSPSNIIWTLASQYVSDM